MSHCMVLESVRDKSDHNAWFGLVCKSIGAFILSFGVGAYFTYSLGVSEMCNIVTLLFIALVLHSYISAMALYNQSPRSKTLKRNQELVAELNSSIRERLFRLTGLEVKGKSVVFKFLLSGQNNEPVIEMTLSSKDWQPVNALLLIHARWVKFPKAVYKLNSNGEVASLKFGRSALFV